MWKERRDVVGVASGHLRAMTFSVSFPVEIHRSDEKGCLMEKVPLVVSDVRVVGLVIIDDPNFANPFRTERRQPRHRRVAVFVVRRQRAGAVFSREYPARG